MPRINKAANTLIIVFNPYYSKTNSYMGNSLLVTGKHRVENQDQYHDNCEQWVTAIWAGNIIWQVVRCEGVLIFHWLPILEMAGVPNSIARYLILERFRKPGSNSSYWTAFGRLRLYATLKLIPFVWPLCRQDRNVAFLHDV